MGRRKNIYSGDYPYPSKPSPYPYSPPFIKDQGYPRYVAPSIYSPPYGECMSDYTIFELNPENGQWRYITTCAKGISHTDAVKRYYQHRAQRPTKVIAFRTVSGKVVNPPTTPDWSETSL